MWVFKGGEFRSDLVQFDEKLKNQLRFATFTRKFMERGHVIVPVIKHNLCEDRSMETFIFFSSFFLCETSFAFRESIRLFNLLRICT